MISIPVRYLHEHLNEDLELEMLAGQGGMDRAISAPRIQKPGLALAGHVGQLHKERVQIIGATEVSYLNTLDRRLLDERVDALCSSGISCLILAKNLDPPDPLTAFCDRYEVPLLRTPWTTSSLIHRITRYLEDVLAPETAVHGSLVDVYGVGILITGASGIGKSECALGLIVRGHRLVGDDVVVIRRKIQDAVVGSAPDLIRYHMEIRGIGILNIKDLFGVSSIRQTKKVELVVELVEWSEDLNVERVGVEEATFSLLDLEIPFLKIPVRPARDLTMIIEVAARNYLLRRMGYNAAKEFDDSLHERLSERFHRVPGPDMETAE